ncbi:methionine--tRNA ligase [candidate division WWE3 bacterium RIFCSPLOWO2_01_FULL_53_14]|uniref:Methionine--tRNA ligase n=1 Tax=candidate division WWE3 bacterium RIFCSPLOWO2_01_FULL_53_14 TaxID=1802628 RepID=A0A1F4VR48_UNCKA|nr:MAG: methionine--tRNA ligase [candidate division WWE3 bacterium RIFCSPLOWO2_01_FULL_53_14]
MQKNRFYVTTAIPYVNAAPHIGFALEIVQADAIARYHRLIGDDTFFLTGTDENALKNVQSAEKAGVPVKKFVDRNSQRFEDLKGALNLSFDDFIRTTEERHVKGAQKLWQACDPDDIYKKGYRGLYCIGCEQFYTEKELVEGKCPEHGTVPETVEEENYFFKLSGYQEQLIKLIESDELKIIPATRKNEVLSFIKGGLEDFSISRSNKRAKGWGVPVPGDESQVAFVWFDALSNYINALGYANDGEKFKKYWLENPNRTHVIGKGIIRFHAVYWPAMLLSAGISLPTEIFVHGYLTVDGQKISKSLGNVIDPFALVEKYGTDPVRYYLLAKFSPFEDGDFSEAKLKETYNSDLANGLGNLVSRVAKLAEGKEIGDQESEIGKEKYEEALKNFRFDEALAVIWSKLSELDKYVNENKPWEKQGGALDKDLQYLISSILSLNFLLEPFLPETAEKIKKQFSGKISPAAPLFPRLR